MNYELKDNQNTHCGCQKAPLNSDSESNAYIIEDVKCSYDDGEEGRKETKGQDASFQILRSGEEPLLSEMEDSLWRHTASGPGQQIKKGKYDCIMDKLSGKNGSQQTVRSPQNLKEFVAFDAFLENAISDNYRYLGFTCTLVLLCILKQFKTEFVIN